MSVSLDIDNRSQGRRHYRRVREHGRVRELRAAIHDFISVCVYWGGAAVLWYLWYRWFMAAVEESTLVAETFLLQIIGMVVLTFVWRRVGTCILSGLSLFYR